MRRGGFGALGACAAIAGLIYGCSAPDLGALPALCDQGGICPDGYACIHGVCAAPSTTIPTTVASLTNLRDVDLKLVPQSGSALVIWQTYAYSDQGEGFYGVRVTPDGNVSPTMAMVTSFEADPGALEPYYDVLPISDTQILLAVAAAPLPDDGTPNPRLLTYEVTLPPQGQEAQMPGFQAAWNAELRMDTIGYGAVSRPKLALRKDDVALGYFRSLTKVIDNELTTAGELAVFSLKQDGSFTTGDPCGSMSIHPARDGLTVAVGVLDAIPDPTSDALWWILDDARPSTLRIGGGLGTSEAKLERLAIPIAGSASALTYIQPSARTGEQLPTDPVEGAASLHLLTLAADAPTSGAGGATPADCTGFGGMGGGGAGGGTSAGAGGDGGAGGTSGAGGVGGGTPPVDTVLGPMPGLRDSPRPIYIPRKGKPDLLVSPGTDVGAPEIGVYTLDPATGAAQRLLGIQRYATSDVGALGAVIVEGTLYVAWTDSSADAAIIRMGVVPEP